MASKSPNKGTKGSKPRKRGNMRNKTEKNNYQDRAMEREFTKGKDSVSPIDSHSFDNDGSWYVARGVMADNVARFPFGISTGMPVDIVPNTTNSKFPAGEQIVPGILALTLAPSVGQCEDPKDPINVAMSALYTGMQINSSRNPQYQANDLSMYCVAMGSAYSFYLWMTRLYGTLNRASALNRYEPAALVTAMGGNYNDLVSNMANFRAYINTFAYMLGSFYVPSDIDYFKRQKFLYENVYMDSENQKGQYYIYRPACFVRWVEGYTDAGGHALTTFLNTAVYDNISNPQVIAQQPLISGYTYDKIAALGNSIINPLRESEDIRIMAADMLKAFGSSSGFQVNPIADTYTVTPVYNREVLSQFENAYIPWMPSTYSYVLEANPDINMSNSLNQVAVSELTSSMWKQFAFIDNTVTTGQAFNWLDNILGNLQQNIIVNSHGSDFDSLQMLVATRLSHMPIGKGTVFAETNNGVVTLNYTNTVGSEYCIGGMVWYYNTNRTLRAEYICSEYLALLQPSQTGDNGTIGSVQSVSNLLTFLSTLMSKWSYISAFDWYPKYHILHNFNGLTGNNKVPLSIGSYSFDVDNWTTITSEEWDRMNYQAMLGLFETSMGDVPRM